MSASSSELWALLGVPALIFLARLVDVTLGTVRIVFVARGLRRWAPAVGFFEILIWLLAIGQVIQHLDRPAHYLAYAAGFAAGTWAGMVVDEKMALGLVVVRIITGEDASDLIEELRRDRFGVTAAAARGVTGRVRLIFTVIRRRDLRRVLDAVRRLHPKAFVSVSDVRQATEGFFDRPLPGNRSSLLERLKRK